MVTPRIEVPCVLVAAVNARECSFVVPPATVPCPGCMACDPGDGIDVPFIVSPGDLLTLVGSDRLPADGTEYGRDALGIPEWFAAVYSPDDAWLTNTEPRWLPLVPGAEVTVPVLDVLPLRGDDGSVKDGDHRGPHVCRLELAHLVRFSLYGENPVANPENVTSHTVWQPDAWTVGATVLRIGTPETENER